MYILAGLHACTSCLHLYLHACVCTYLQDTLGVRSLPTLIWVSPNGEILTRRGVASVLKDTEGALFPWKEKAVKDVDEALESLADEPVLLAFVDGINEEAQQQVQKVRLGFRV